MKTASAMALLLLIPSLMSAQPDDVGVRLSLDQALELALAESYSARELALTLLEAEQNVDAARGRFKTRANLAFDAPNYREDVQAITSPGELPQYESTGRRMWRGQLNVDQPLPTNGFIRLDADVFEVLDTRYDFVLDDRTKQRTFQNSFGISFSQPLFTPNSLKLGLARANLALERSQRRYTRTQLNIVYDVTNVFYQLLQAQLRLDIADDTVKQQKESYELARVKFEAGLIPEVEALQMEVDLAQSRNDRLSAEGLLARTADQFKLTVGLPMDRGVSVEAQTEVKRYAVDEAFALEHALEHRSEIYDAAADLRLAEITLEETDARKTIRAQVDAFYRLTGVSDPELGTGDSVFDLWDSSLNDLERRPGNRGVIFTLSVPLWDSGVTRAEVGAARAALGRSDLSREESRRQVIQQVNATLTRFNEALARLDVLKKSEAVAQRSHEISLGRFRNGDITSQELALDRDRLTSARLNYLDAFIQYQLSTADLKRQTLYDFENDQSLVEAP